jgi:hypothetical protein
MTSVASCTDCHTEGSSRGSNEGGAIKSTVLGARVGLHRVRGVGSQRRSPRLTSGEAQHSGGSCFVCRRLRGVQTGIPQHQRRACRANGACSERDGKREEAVSHISTSHAPNPHTRPILCDGQQHASRSDTRHPCTCSSNMVSPLNVLLSMVVKVGERRGGARLDECELERGRCAPARHVQPVRWTVLLYRRVRAAGGGRVCGRSEGAGRSARLLMVPVASVQRPVEALTGMR